MATNSRQPLMTADLFLQIRFPPDVKAELDNGVIRMMAGGSRADSRAQMNIGAALTTRLRGSGCRADGPDMAIRTHDGSVRYPDVSVAYGHNGPDDDHLIAITDPQILVEILSPTAAEDRGVKLDEYKALPSVETILLVDPDRERVRIVQRTGRDPDGWSDVDHVRPHDIALPSLGITLPHQEIFARD